MMCNSKEHGHEITCMRHSSPDGKCEVADKSPQLWEENDLAVDIFWNCIGSAENIDTEKKVYQYLRMSDIDAAMNAHSVSQDEKPLVVKKLMLLQDIYNRLKRNKKKR